MLVEAISELRKELTEVKQTLAKAAVTDNPKVGKSQTVEQEKVSATQSAINDYLARKRTKIWTHLKG